MARRMFSSRIINSARFLQMSEGAQLLYFHLGMRADDDGIVEAYPVMKLLGTKPDDFKILCAKEFVMQLNAEQVIFIKDWKEHNTIRADRKINSVYIDLLMEVAPEAQLTLPTPRSDVENNSKRIGGPSTDGISKVKLSKDKVIQRESTPSQKAQEFFDGKTIYQEMLAEFSNGRDQVLIEKEFKKFVLYWTEPNKSGTKVRWQQQNTFEIKRRIFMWMSRVNDYNTQPRSNGKIAFT